MSSILFTGSDFHIGHKSAEQTALEFFGECGFFELLRGRIEIEKRNGNDILGFAICGDLFDHKISVDSPHAKIAMQFMQELANLIIVENEGTIINLRGTYSHDFSQNDIFKNFEEIYEGQFAIVNEVCAFELEGYSVLCIPEEYMKNQEEFYADYFNEKYDIILGHGFFKFNCFNKNEVEKHVPEMPTFDQDQFCEMASLIVFGHDHGRITYKDKLHYNGSFTRLCHTDEEEKGYMIHTLKKVKGETKVISARIDNLLTESYKTFFLKEIHTRDIEDDNSYESVVRAINDKSLDYDYLKIKLSSDDVVSHPNLLGFLKEYYASKKNITIEGSNVKLTNNENVFEDSSGKESSDNEVEDLKSTYMFDDAIPLADKILRFIKDKFEDNKVAQNMSLDDINELISKDED